VIMPAKCVSSIAPRFHYRRLAFCFLPLAAILASLILTFVLSFCSTAENILFQGLNSCLYFFNQSCQSL
jgi:hypothetical protein